MNNRNNIAIALLVFVLGVTSVSNAAARVPLIEPDNRSTTAPPGYRWYIVRDWTQVFSGKAHSVTVGALLQDTPFPADELIFGTAPGDTLRERPPTTAGQLSRVLLPASFQLPPEVVALRALPVPDRIPGRPVVDLGNITFREEPSPPGAPTGYRAVTFVIPGQVYSGVADSFALQGGAFQLHGNRLHLRPSTVAGEASHILLSPAVTMPESVVKMSAQ